VKDPEGLGAVPVCPEYRVPFQTLLGYIEGGQTLGEVPDDLPTVTRDAAVRALGYAKSLVTDRPRSRSCSTNAFPRSAKTIWSATTAKPCLDRAIEFQHRISGIEG
jgi:uncharacterized protein (DUF433 family)